MNFVRNIFIDISEKYILDNSFKGMFANTKFPQKVLLQKSKKTADSYCGLMSSFYTYADKWVHLYLCGLIGSYNTNED
jgi:hypothetical protein